MILVLIIYFLPIILSIIIASPVLFTLLTNKEKLKKNKDYSIRELKKIQPIIITQLLKIIEFISILFLIPIMIFRFTLMMIYGVKITWKLPVSFIEIWCFLWLIIGYYFAWLGNYKLSLLLEAMVLLSVMHMSFVNFIRRKGKIRLFEIPEHKIGIASHLTELLIVIFSFSSLFYTVSQMNLNSFNIKMSVFDSIYYSIISAITVGYGDIVPITNVAKSLTIMEVIIVFIYVIVLFGVIVNMWIENKRLYVKVNDKKTKKNIYSIRRNRYFR